MKTCKNCGYKGDNFLKGFLICNNCLEKENKNIKIQPLKNKKFQIIKGVIYSEPSNFQKGIDFCYFEKDIKSALLFLKKEFDYLKKYETQDVHKLIIEKINNSFKEVLKEWRY